MSRGKGIPSNVDAEAALLGCILLRPSVMGEMIDRLDSGDFLKPNHRKAFEAVRALHVTGKPIDVLTVSAVAEQMYSDDGQGNEWLGVIQDLVASPPSISNYGRYAETVIDNSRRRAVIGRLGELSSQAYEYDNPIDEIIAEATAINGDHLIANRDGSVTGLFSAAEMAVLVDTQEDLGNKPWLIPGTMKPGWRIIVVAGEGVGKAVLMRFLAAHAAAGRDPWSPTTFIEPRRVLYVDVENEAETVVHQLRIANRAHDLIKESEDRLHIWHREGGINLRHRRSLAEFESVLQKTQPEIVFAGPLYKLFRRSPKEDLEQAALEFTEIIDDLRVRYGFAIMLEHHAPKASGGAFRDLNPFGSSLFMRWPVIGLTLDFDGPVSHDSIDYVLNIGRFRRDRVLNDWPNAIERSSRSKYAFSGFWSQGCGTKLEVAARLGL